MGHARTTAGSTHAGLGPRQIVDLWDLALRGLPLGSLMLVRREEGKWGKSTASNGPVHELPPGWDLLDGQQRIRALVLGLRGPVLEEKRCLWIDLSQRSEAHCLSIHLTSESQPFDRPDDGSRLSVGERRAAREKIEPDCDRIKISRPGICRDAYNHELFSGFIDGTIQPTRPSSAWKLGWPPLPAKADDLLAVFPMHVY